MLYRGHLQQAIILKTKYQYPTEREAEKQNKVAEPIL